MKEPPYGLSVDLDLPLGRAIAATKDPLKAEGFGILTEIDVLKTLEEKIGSGAAIVRLGRAAGAKLAAGVGPLSQTSPRLRSLCSGRTAR